MDPMTAMLILGGVQTGLGLLQSSRAKREAKRAEEEQRSAQLRQSAMEQAQTSQNMTARLASARNRPTRSAVPGENQSLGVSALGTLSQNAGTAGTF